MSKNRTNGLPTIAAVHAPKPDSEKHDESCVVSIDVGIEKTTKNPRQTIQGWLCKEDAETLRWVLESLENRQARLNNERIVQTEFDAIRYMLQDIRKNINS